jgi:hypothetical protein
LVVAPVRQIEKERSAANGIEDAFADGAPAHVGMGRPVDIEQKAV